MFFKKSKKKQLQEIRLKLFLLRDSLIEEKKYAMHVVNTCRSPMQIRRNMEQLYDYIIAKLREIEYDE